LSFVSQIGVVSGGITSCGDPNIPDYYVRLDHPEIASFISGIDMDLKGKKNVLRQTYIHQRLFRIRKVR
jgi:hypothetical protein